MRRVALVQRLRMAAALVLREGRRRDVGLVHVRELGADRLGHALAVAGVGVGRAGQIDAGEMLRHVIRRPVEAAGRQDHALARA